MEDKNRDEKDEENIQCCVWIRQKTSKIICNDSLPWIKDGQYKIQQAQKGIEEK